MTAVLDGLLTEVGKKATERWLSPAWPLGLCFAAASWCAITLGHAHALDLGLLVRRTRDGLTRIGVDPVALVTVGVLAVAAAVAAAGLARLAVGAVERLWLLERRGRRLTWPGRRLALLEERVRAEYHGLRVSLVWPRLWALLEDHQRVPVREARAALDTAALTAGWGLLYALLGCLWWPGAVVAAGLLTAGRSAARRHAHAYATLVESLVDVRQRELATALGVELPHGVITEVEAGQINARLNKGGPDLPARRRPGRATT
ncbi:MULTISPECIES: hypothetical protein [unclassified Nonomuraea]|uniref:hypothetical protein n=1 Tax=unclassified Nonomuraea TaxID=2593643 RepID=UPI0033C5AC8E